MSQKWVQVLSKVIGLTQSNQLKWEETSDPDIFQTSIGGATVEIEVNAPSHDFTVRILSNTDGKIVDNFGPSDLHSLTGNPWTDEVFDMVTTIRRRLSGTERIIDGLLLALTKKEDEIPF